MSAERMNSSWFWSGSCVFRCRCWAMCAAAHVVHSSTTRTVTLGPGPLGGGGGDDEGGDGDGAGDGAGDDDGLALAEGGEVLLCTAQSTGGLSIHEDGKRTNSNAYVCAGRRQRSRGCWSLAALPPAVDLQSPYVRNHRLDGLLGALPELETSAEPRRRHCSITSSGFTFESLLSAVRSNTEQNQARGRGSGVSTHARTS